MLRLWDCFGNVCECLGFVRFFVFFHAGDFGDLFATSFRIFLDRSRAQETNISQISSIMFFIFSFFCCF